MTVLSCEGRRLADGSVVLDVLTTSPDAKTRKLATSYRYLIDGSVSWFTAYNYDPIFDGDEGPNRKEVAVTFEQLHKLSTDPELTFL